MCPLVFASAVDVLGIVTQEDRSVSLRSARDIPGSLIGAMPTGTGWPVNLASGTTLTLIAASNELVSVGRRKAKVFVEHVDPKVVFARDKGMCGICKSSVAPDSKWEVDHVIPISKGGAHSYDNVQLSHRKCNRAKWASLPKGQPTLFQVVP